MADKSFAVRVVMKHDTQANWAQAVNFVPKNGEVIVYTDYYTSGNSTVPGIKIGDGVNKVGDLPFIDKRYAAHILNDSIHYTIAVDTDTEVLQFAYEE